MIKKVRKVLHDMRQGRMKPVFKAGYRSVFHSQIKYEAVLDRVFHRQKESDLLPKVTAVIKTFERPRRLKILLSSLKRLYPSLKIIVVDDSRRPGMINGVENIHLPYDSGVSAGRQAGLDAVETEYILNLDDDYIFSRKTDILSSVLYLEGAPDVGLVGGRVRMLPYYLEHDYFSHFTMALMDDKENKVQKGTDINGLIVYEKTANFWLARTDEVRQIGWDPQLKRLDHSDFFSRARGKIVTVYNPAMEVLHAPTYFNKDYLKIRTDYRQDIPILAKRYHFDPVTGEKQPSAMED